MKTAWCRKMKASLLGFSRVIRTVALAASVAVSATGCGGPPSEKTSTLGEPGVVVGERVTVKGTVSLRGSTPYPVVLLELDNGGLASIKSNEFQAELESLAGMKVSIEGEVLPSSQDGPTAVRVLSYYILPLPSGEIPIVGVLDVRENQCVLETAEGRRYWLRGDFVALLADFAGAKVWVVGESQDAALPEKPKGSEPLWVTGYGVLSQ